MRFSPHKKITHWKSAFSLIEIVAVIAILIALLTAGVSLIDGTGAQSRKASTDLLIGLIEQAKATAVTSHSYVVLAFVAPTDLPDNDNRCRIGLFKVEEWPEASGSAIELTGATQLNRWSPINTGIALVGGNVNGIVNPIDEPKISINYGGSKNQKVNAHAIAFNPRGALHFPAGSTPIALRIAEGSYRSGKPAANAKGPSRATTENRLKIGRLTARPYPIEG